MGLSMLNVILKSNFRLFKPKLLSNFCERNKEFKCTRFMSNYLQKTPVNTTKKVSCKLF